VKKIIIAVMVVLVFITPAFANSVDTTEGGSYNYLHVVNDQVSQFFQFNEKGEHLAQNGKPIQLKEGYILVTTNEPITVKGPFSTIVLQKESLLTIGRTASNKPSYYLVGGSASFLLERPFSGDLEVSTPIGIYNVSGPGEIFITSDASELIFNLGAVVRATNAITRETTDVKPFYYLNMADPFKNQKQLSQQSYRALSISREEAQAKTLISEKPVEEITVKVPATVFVEQEVAVAKEPVKIEEPIVEKEKEVFNFYVIHTGDILGQMRGDGIGFEQLSTLYKWAKGYLPNTVILDTGNSLGGTEVVEAFKGEPMGYLLDAVGYDAVTPSATDYSYGLSYLKEMADMASRYSNLAVLGANVIDENGNFIFEPYRIYDFNSYKVGVIGASFAHGFELTESLLNQGQTLVDEVASKSDFIILLGNFGFENPTMSETIAQSLKNIDLIVDGSNANIGPAGKVINGTLIVKSLAKLESVGIVEVRVEDNEAVALYPVQIRASEVKDPSASTLAQAFGILNVPYDDEITSFIDQQNSHYLALLPKEAVVEKEKVEVPETKVIEVVEPKEVEVAVKTDDAITIKQPLGIISAQETTTEGGLDWGVSATFNLTRDTFNLGKNPLVGFSLNPFISYKNFALGLQGYFLTDGSLLSPSTYSFSSKLDTSSTMKLLSSTLRFIDFVRYGEKDDSLFLLADGVTPISFGNRLIVDSLNVASGPYEEKLGFYLSAKIGLIGLETFFDNLYFDQWIGNETQTGGLRVSINPKGAFEFGLSSLIQSDLGSENVLYPALDFIWRIKNERKLGLELFGGIATRIGISDFTIKDLFDKDQTSLFEMFPNFLAAGGLDIRTLNWNLRLIAAAQNRTHADNLLSLGSLNSTNYSGTDMIDTGDGLHYQFGVETAYNNQKLGLEGSYYVPVNKDFTDFINIKGTTTTGDRFAVQGGYNGNSFEAALGFRRVGLISAAKTLFTSSASNILSNLKTFIYDGDDAQPYLSLTYKKGIYRLNGEVAVVDKKPRINLSASVAVGKNISALDPKEQQNLFGKIKTDDKLKIGASLDSAYTRLFFASGIDNNYLSLKPTVELSKGEKFAIGIGPRFTLGLYDLDFISGNNDSFDFGTASSGALGIAYDIATDVFSLIDYVNIGTEGDKFRLNYGGNQTFNFGPLVKNLVSLNNQSMVETKALSAFIDTDVVKAQIFVNDMTKLQLGGFRVGFAPFKKYRMELGISALGNLELADNSRIFMVPALDLKLPIVNSEKAKIALQTTVAASLGYDNGFKQLLFGDTGSVLEKFENFIVSANLNFTFGKFCLDFEAALADGALSYGMFNSFYDRERSDSIEDAIDDAFDPTASVGKTYSVGTTFGFNSNKFDLSANYTLDLNNSFIPQLDDGLLNLDAKIKFNWFDLTLSYNRNKFIGSIKNLISGSGSLVSRVKSFALNNDSSFGASVGFRQGPITFTTMISTYANSSLTNNTYNSYDVDDTSLALTLGAKINVF